MTARWGGGISSLDQTSKRTYIDSVPPSPAPQPFAKRPGVALHHQIKEDLFHKLRSGEWPPGAEMPSEHILCTHYGVSRGTLRRALADLVSDGYVERHSGRGTFVCRPKLVSGVTSAYSRSSVVGPAVDPGGRVLLCRRVKADRHVAAMLQSRGAVWQLERVRFTDGQAIGLQTSFIPVVLCPDLAKQDLQSKHLVDLMRDIYGVHFGSAVEYLDPGIADSHVARHLGIRVNALVFRIERTAYTVDGRAAEYRNAVLRGDMYRYRIELR